MDSSSGPVTNPGAIAPGLARKPFFAAGGQGASIITKRSRRKSFRTPSAFCFLLRFGGIMKGASLYEGTGFISFGHGSGAHTLAAPGAARFEATRWSEVLQSAQSRAPGGPEALARLCERYWPTLFA